MARRPRPPASRAPLAALAWRIAGAWAALVPAAALALEPQPDSARYRLWSWPDVAHTSTVWSVTQARAGHLWIATREGAVRFDGRRMTPLDARRVPGLVAREVTSIVEGRGILWIGAREGGLFAVRLTGDAEGEILARTPGLVIRQMTFGPDGTLWIAGHDGMARVPPGQLHARRVNEGLPSIVASRVAIDAGGTPWAGTAKGAARWDGGRWNPVAGPGGSMAAADAFACDPDGTVWVGARGAAGLWRWRDGAWRVYTHADGLPDPSVIAMRRDHAGRLWVATVGGGLAWLDGERFRASPTPSAACADRVLDMAEDREEGMWLATRCGLHRLRDPLFSTVDQRDGLPTARVLALATVDGAPWAATTDGVARWTADGRFVPVACVEGCGECHAISAAGRAAAWITCLERPIRLATPLIVRDADPAIAGARAVMDANDGARWIDRGAEVVRVAGGVATPIPGAAAVGARRLFHQGRAGRVWIVGSEGVLRWERGAAKVLRDAHLSRATPASAYEDADGTLWFGTHGGGVRRVTGDALTQIDPRHGLPTGWVAGILEDDAGHLWMSSSRGLLRVARAALDDVADGRRTWVNVSVFDAREGVALTEQPFLGTPSALRDDRGRLWFATNAGVVIVDPPALRVAAPPVTIDELRLGGRPLPLASAARGDVSGRQTVEVHLAAVTFEAPQTVSTRYRLEGWDGGWTEGPAAAVARWTDVRPGRYRFRAHAVSRDGTSAGSEVSLAIVLAPPFYLRPWFLPGAVAVAASGLMWAHRLRLARTRARLAAVMGERARIARDIHDTLAQAFVATQVQLECVDKALEDGNLASAQGHLATARQVVTGSLEEARRSVWVLRPQALDDGLAAALQSLVDRATGQPAVTLYVAGKARRLPAAVEAHLLRIAQEAVANAVRHAGATRVEVRLQTGAATVCLTIRDDGRGIPPAAGPAEPGRGAGLPGMRERAAQLGAPLVVETGATGTTVEIEVRA